MAGKGPTRQQIRVFWGVFETLILVVQLAKGIDIHCKCDENEEAEKADEG